MDARSYQGSPLFSAGFRPFFLLGSLYAGLAILVWMPVFTGELRLVTAPPSSRATGTSTSCFTVSCLR